MDLFSPIYRAWAYDTWHINTWDELFLLSFVSRAWLPTPLPASVLAAMRAWPAKNRMDALTSPVFTAAPAPTTPWAWPPAASHARAPRGSPETAARTLPSRPATPATESWCVSTAAPASFRLMATPTPVSTYRHYLGGLGWRKASSPFYAFFWYQIHHRRRRLSTFKSWWQ